MIVKQEDFKIYYGIPSSHSSYSIGEGSPNDVFNYVRHNGLDFVILTDHNNYLDEETKIKSSKQIKWIASKNHSEYFNKKHDNFLSIIGFQCSVPPFGDFNLIGSNTFFKGSVKDLKKLILWLFINPAIISITHPHSSMEALPYNEYLNKYIKLFEIGNGFGNKYVRFEKRFYKMLDKGWKLGAINSQDNLKLTLGDTSNITGICCKSLSYDDLLGALNDRRTYSTESSSLHLFYWINSSFMGDVLKITEGEKLHFKINIYDDENSIEKLQIITSNGKIERDLTFPKQKNLTYITNFKWNKNNKWFLVKIFLENNKLAFSSPIFLEETTV